jgi:RHS repeat-associated protein
MSQVLRNHSLLFFVLPALLSFAVFAGAQVNPGTPSWSAYDSGQYDTINLQNLNVSVSVPFMSKNGAMPFSAQLGTLQSFIWLTSNSYIEPATQLLPFTGYVNGLIGFGGSTAVSYTSSSAVTCPSQYGSGSATKITGWFVQLADGTQHYLPTTDVTYYGANCSSSFTDTTTDNSAFTVTVTGGTPTSVYTSSGLKLAVDGSSVSDAQSSPNTISFVPLSYEWKDSLGLVALQTSGLSYSWTDVNGGSPSVTMTNASSTLKTVYSCSGATDTTTAGIYLPTNISFPDSSSLGFSWEPTPGYGSDTTGRLSKITLRDGSSTIQYNWNPNNASHDGLNCTYLVPASLKRTTLDGAVTYTLAFSQIGSSSNYKETNTKIDIGGNKTVYTFTGLISTGNAAAPTIQALTQVQYYPNTGTVSSPSYAATSTQAEPAETVTYCYNGNSSSCSTASVSAPITEVDTYTDLGLSAGTSRHKTTFDAYGNVIGTYSYDYGASSYTLGTVTSYGSWNGTSCASIGSNINNKPCEIYTTDGTNTISESLFTYDSHGNLLKTQVYNGSTWLGNSTSNVYNSNGTISTAYDLRNNATTYAYSSGYYGSCSGCTQYPFATSLTKGGLTTYATWNGTGGVKTEDEDANGNITIYGYKNSSGTADPWWRVMSVTDPLSNKTWNTYTATSFESSFEFNSSSSIQDTTKTFDGYGRLINVQRQQGVGSSNYDTVSYSYNFSGVNPTVFTSMPCSQTSGNSCGSTYGNTTMPDMLGRVLSVTNTNSGPGAVTNTYTQNDVVTKLSPAPSGENTKQTQKQYDGLGRLTSTCGIESSGGSSCGQNIGSASGIITNAYYSTSPWASKTSQTRGSQTRTQQYDSLGRVTSVNTPEGGTVTYVWDAANVNCGNLNQPGQLMQVKYANGNYVCYSYDALGRKLVAFGVLSGGTTTCNRYAYDSISNKVLAQPSGSTISNVAGRLMEAETDNCASPTPTTYTDEWFSYDNDGRLTDIWESTPNSGTYYHSSGSFTGPTLTGMSFVNPSLALASYTLDGEGRWNTFTHGVTTVVSGTTYNPAGQPTRINLGSGTDYDSYIYDLNTGLMTNWTYQVNSVTQTGALTWNYNGSLKQLVITDGFNSGGTQTCSFNSSLVTGTGYDDLGRLVGSSCGSGGSTWNQTDSYDQYDNICKTSSGFVSWCPTYSSSPSNNHFTGTGVTYDSSGNVTNDGTNAYTWNGFNKMAGVNPSGTGCSTSGQCLIYDALGRVVEIDSGSTKTEIWYSLLGKSFFMNGSSIVDSYLPTPGGGTQLYIPGPVHLYLHKDWLGNARLLSNVAASTVTTDRAFAPYGEVYDIFGGTSQNQTMFTGNTQDVIAGMIDTPNRELHTSQQGRFLSPDPANAGWNLYAYPTNPNSFTDPTGLVEGGPNGPFCMARGRFGAHSAIQGCSGGYGSDPGVDTGGPSGYTVNPAGPGGTGAQGTVAADGGTVSAATEAYFDSLDGTQGDVTQERDDPDPETEPADPVPSGGGPCYYVLVNPCGGGAANNVTNCTPLTPGCSNVPTAKQQWQHSLGCDSNSLMDKGIRFFSLMRIGEHPIEWGVFTPSKLILTKWLTEYMSPTELGFVEGASGVGTLAVLGSTLLDAPCFMPAPSAVSDPAPPSPFSLPQ